MPETPDATPPGPKFKNENPQVRNLFQVEHIDTLYASQPTPTPVTVHSFADGPLNIGQIPTLTAARQEREADKQLVEALSENATAVLCQVLAGMGGVGKTQIAAAFARKRWDARELDLLIWVNAAEQDSIKSTFAEAGTKICGVEGNDPDQSVQEFLTWLDRPGGPKWLIVLDDVTDPNDLNDLWPPEAPHGRTVVTTRTRHAAWQGDHREVVDVDHFTPEEAMEYLGSRLGKRSNRINGAAELAEELGCLPLALAQAAAYILDDPTINCAEYHRLLDDKETGGLANLSPELHPNEYRRSVAAALQLSIDAAESHQPKGLTTALLRMASLMNPAGIPIDLFFCEVTRAALTKAREQEDGAEVRPDSIATVRSALARLHKLSVLNLSEDQVRVHALVQRVVRDGLQPGDLDLVARSSADALIEIWPSIENDPGLSAALRANASLLHKHAKSALFKPDAHTVLFKTGRSLGETGQVEKARRYFEQLLTDCRETLGPDHPDALFARHEITYWRGQTGEPAEAATAFEALLDDCLRILGPDHPDTLTTRHNLADWRGRTGDPEEAATAFEALLEDCLRILGPDHPDTLFARNNLAGWRGEAGDPEGATTALETLLEDRLRILGPNHPDTLVTRDNLAGWRGEAGDPEGATTALETLLEDRLRILGPNHPDTLTTRNNLAYWRGRTGDPEGATTAFEALLEDCLRILGPDHPNTLTTRDNLARWRGEAGDPEGATTALETLLEDRLRILGPNHPDTLTTRNNLAYWRGRTGDPEGATTAFEALLEDRLRILGPNHPDTLTTRNNLAHWRDKAGIDGQNPSDPD